MQKAERLMAITLLLQARGKLTARRLADVLGVSVRTVYRDVNALSLAHVPITMDYGPGGGYFLPDDYRLDLAPFTPEEVAALALGAILAAGSHLMGSEEGLRQALIKLEAGLAEEHRETVRIARERILLDPVAWYRRPAPSPFLEPVRTALWQGRQIRILYHGSAAPEPEWRQVDPLGLVCKGGVWYLVAYCHRRKGLRTFRVSRVADVESTDKPVMPRPGFHLESFWRETQQRFEESIAALPVTLRLSHRIRYYLENEYTLLAEEPDGSVVARVSRDSVGDAVRYALSLGADVEVLDPPQVREGVAAAAREVAALYQLRGAG